MNKIGLIIRREYLTRVRKKSFILMTLLGPFLIAGLMMGAIYLGLSDDTNHFVLVVDQTPELENNMRAFEGRLDETAQIKFDYADEALTNEEFKTSPYSLMLVINENIVSNPMAEL